MHLKFKYLYFLTPIILWILQTIYTVASMNNLRPDEIYTIRDVLPFQNRELAGPGASSIAFYAAILILFNIFGFDIYTPKFYRLGLQLISLFCLSIILKKYLGEKRALLPLLVIGLSPTLLYWTTMEAAWGIDLQFIPIVIYLVDTLTPKRVWTYFTGPVLGGLITMLSWMSYASFMFYLPFIFWFFLKKLSSFNIKTKLLLITSFLISFIIPVIGIYSYIVKRDTLFFDPDSKRGLFTGGGEMMFNEDEFIKSTLSIFTNLFDKATSYVFEIHSVDFSYFLPVLVFAFIIIVPLKFFSRSQEIKPLIFWVFATMLLNLILTGLILDGSGMPGGRRNTPFLAAIYCLFIITWYLISSKNISLKITKWLTFGTLSILLAHHLIVYPINLYYLLKPPTTTVASWFSIKETPGESVNYLLGELQKGDLNLDCEGQLAVSYPLCYYSSIYAILTQACMHNNLNCHYIKAKLPFESDYQKLDYEFFSQNKWEN